LATIAKLGGVIIDFGGVEYIDWLVDDTNIVSTDVIRQSSISRRKPDYTNYIYLPYLEVVEENMDRYTVCTVDIDKGHMDICDYGGKCVRSQKTVDILITGGCNKILNVKGENMWWVGGIDVGSYFNHACDCVSNCHVEFDEEKNMMPVIKSKDFMIPAYTALTIDYGIDVSEQRPNDVSMKWYFDYKCPKCKGRSGCEGKIQK